MVNSEYQAKYYQDHIETLRNRHRERERLVRSGKIKRKKRIRLKCAICHDGIVGGIKYVSINGKKVRLDQGCYQWLKERRFSCWE